MAEKRALITGITGFAGSHLAELLLKKKIKVYGTCRWRSRTENIEDFKNKLNLIEGDLLDLKSLQKIMMDVKPDYVFHLAAQSFVPASWASPAATLETNVVGSVNLFEAIRSVKIDPLVQIACSSEEYGLVHPNEVPIKEDNPLRPLSPYAVSKVSLDFLGYQYHQSYGLKIVRTRGFNHTGPRRGEVFVCSAFAKQVAEIEKGKQKPILSVGNLKAIRDFTDVRDMVQAYWLAATKGKPGEVYNICSGKGVEIQTVLDKLLKMSKTKITVKQDPDRMRPSDVPILLGDCSKFKRQTGWKPKIGFDQTLKDVLDYWRERV
ncbi:MAG: GDP-mannose 4,6-dehydratase [Patescibacteria group bacterium]